MSKLFITSDQHWSHRNIIDYCNRPFTTTHEMNKFMIDKWNEVVSDEDDIIHVGDVFAGGSKREYEHIVRLLNGKKHLVRGNHDRWSDELWKNRFTFSTVQEFLVLGKYFICHYPLSMHSKQKPHEIEMIELLREAYKLSGCEYVFHGHSHNSKVTDYPKNHYNVGVDNHGFYPIDFKEKVKQLNWL